MLDTEKTTVTEDQQQEDDNRESVMSSELSEEIDVAIETVMEDVVDDNESDDDEPSDEELSPDEDEKEESSDEVEVSEEETPEEEVLEEDAITDELLERAVKAGFSLADAKAFPNATMLGNMCDRLEQNDKDEADEGQADEGNVGDGDDDLLAMVPDLDPEEYDEQVVAGFKALKNFVRQQQMIIEGLQEDNAGSAKSLFDRSVAGLGDTFEKTFDQTPKRKDDLKEQFDILVAGNKAAGKVVDHETLFDHAVKIALGDVVARGVIDGKSKKLQKRGKRIISRSDGSKTTATTKDAFEDAAEALDRKFF